MKLIIIDSSAVVRTILEQNLTKYENIQIISSVSNCQKILKTVFADTPDAVICGTDISEPNEKEALKLICREMKLPVILLTAASLPFISKLIDKTEKPALNNYTEGFFKNLIQKLSVLVSKNPKSAASKSSSAAGYRIVCLGASTGGPTAVSEVLNGLGNKFPLPVLYTQHIEIGKDKELADWLNSVCHNLTIKLAEDGEEAKPGYVYMAPADKHLIISYLKTDGTPVLRLSDEAPERFLRPAVNKLFKSAAEKFKNNVIAVLLTGMGADGSEGIKYLNQYKRTYVISQEASTCVVYGMPKAVEQGGLSNEVVPLQSVANSIVKRL